MSTEASMNHQAYEQLVQRAERLAQSNPTRYKSTLVGYSLLGYLVIFAMLVALLAATGGLVYLSMSHAGFLLFLFKSKIFLLTLPLSWVLLRALWVRFEKPTGFELKRHDHPELFAEIDSMCSSLKAPAIHRVLLTPEFNASIVQTPRLGIFGWQHNTLSLGLELLLALNAAQAKAVIAHELGHLSGSHSAFAAWIYRSRISWSRIMYSFTNNDSWGGALMRRFFNWYAPRFSAYSFTLARSNEYEADAIAAQLTSANDTAQALIAVMAKSDYVEKNYWHGLYASADTSSIPVANSWSNLSQFLQSEKNANFQTSLDTALAYTSDFSDTHPSLTQRLDALGVSPSLPEPISQHAAKVWFGDSLSSVLSEFDDKWLEENTEGWKQRHEYVISSQQEIQSLHELAPNDMSDEQLWRRVVLWSEFKTNEETLDVISDYIARNPDDLDIYLMRGKMLCEAGNEAGLADLEKSLENKHTASTACEIAFYFLSNLNRKEEAEIWRSRAIEIDEANQKLHMEISKLNRGDKLTVAELSEEEAARLVEALKSSKLVKKAWVAKKVVADDAGYPYLAIAFVVRGWFHFSEERVTNRLEKQMPEDFAGWLIPKMGYQKKLAKKIIKQGQRLL